MSATRKIDYDRYEDVIIQKKDAILTITMNAPEIKNAFPSGMHRTFATIWDDITDDPEVNVVIVTGAGQAFSAGGDTAKMQRKIDNPESFENETVPEARRMIFRMLECDKPIIARVNGNAIGLGATTALMCDIVVMADHAKIGDPHVYAGLNAGDGGSVIWPQILGFSRAKEHLLMGTLIPAPEAYRIGLVNHVVPAAELDERVHAIASRLAQAPPRAIRYTKQTLNIPLRQIAHSQMDLSMSLETQAHMSKDHQEAVWAFQQKRKPKFTGK